MANYETALERYYHAEVMENEHPQILFSSTWDKLNLDKIDNQNVANLIFIIGVRLGVKEAGKVLQIGTNTNSFKKLKVDGIIGSKTIEAVNKVKDATTLNNHIVDLWKERDERIIRNNDRLKVFRAGRLYRAESYRI